MNDDDAVESKTPQADRETEPAEARPAGSPIKPPPAWLRVGQLLLPFALCGVALAVHWSLNVPDKIHKSPNDQGAKKPRAKDDKKKKRAKDSGRLGQNKRQPARSAEELERDWERYGALPFDDEPTRADWARRHQAIVNRAVVVARRAAFERAPERPQVVLVEATCRTVRCRVLMRSPNANELDIFGEAFGKVEAGGESVWRSFESEPAEAPADAPEPTSDRFVQITVAFQSDETNTRDLMIPADDGEDANEEGSNDEGSNEDDEEPNAAPRKPEPGGA